MNPKKTDVSAVPTDIAKASNTGETKARSTFVSGKGYFPPYPLLQQAVSEERNSRGELQALKIPRAIFIKLMRNYYEAVGFDEAGYLERYPDVAEGIKEGKVKSPIDHFVNNGFFEGRLANYVRPEDVWYLLKYPDVARAIRSRVIPSANDHYTSTGAREGRAPTAQMEPVIEEWLSLISGEANQKSAPAR